jgi:hypothetical protein
VGDLIISPLARLRPASRRRMPAKAARRSSEGAKEGRSSDPQEARQPEDEERSERRNDQGTGAAEAIGEEEH